MEHYFLSLTKTEFEEFDTSLDAICEENEKYPGNALFFLTNALQSSHNVIATCWDIIREKEFPKDINCFCGCNMHFTLTSKVLKKGLYPEKEKELIQMDEIVWKALDTLDGLADKKFNTVLPNLKIQQVIYKQVYALILDLVNKDSIIEKIKNADSLDQFEITRFYMNSGKFSDDSVQFFLDTFINGKLDLAA